MDSELQPCRGSQHHSPDRGRWTNASAQHRGSPPSVTGQGRGKGSSLCSWQQPQQQEALPKRYQDAPWHEQETTWRPLSIHVTPGTTRERGITPRLTAEALTPRGGDRSHSPQSRSVMQPTTEPKGNGCLAALPIAPRLDQLRSILPLILECIWRWYPGSHWWSSAAFASWHHRLRGTGIVPRSLGGYG